LCLEIDNPMSMTYAVFGLGLLEARQGDWLAASRYYAEALELCRETNNRSKTGNVLEGSAGALYHYGENVPAACTYGAADKMRKESGTPVPPFGREPLEQGIQK